jgi:hypothetical protein
MSICNFCCLLPSYGHMSRELPAQSLAGLSEPGGLWVGVGQSKSCPGVPPERSAGVLVMSSPSFCKPLVPPPRGAHELSCFSVKSSHKLELALMYLFGACICVDVKGSLEFLHLVEACLTQGES